MRLLVLGASGQVGHELQRLGVPGAARTEADITDRDAVAALLDRARPELVFNAAAYTAVDRAESDTAAAYAVNRDAVATLAVACKERGIALLHYSTDYVFDGRATRPYREDDPVSPIGVYGRSKCEGEQAVRAALDRHIILRTAWVFSAHGHNFVKTILRLAQERGELKVVADQYGCPTPAAAIAAASLEVARQVLQEPGERWGTYHFGGVPPTTWHGFAQAVLEAAGTYFTLKTEQVHPITTAEYPTAATRPPWSVLDCGRIKEAFGIEPAAWEMGLKQVIGELASV